MALIKRADADSFAKEAVKLHLGNLEREGESLVAEAKTRAESILAKARAERDRLIAGAAERGYKAGFAKGQAEGLEKGGETGEARALESTSGTISALAEQWGLVLARFEEERENMVSEARRDVVRLAAVLAEKVTRRAVDLDPTTVDRTMEAVLRRVIGPTALIIAVNPDDVARGQRLLPAMMERVGGSAHATVVPDEKISRGGCVVRTDGGGVIDADIETQINRLVSTLLPGEEKPLPSPSDPHGPSAAGIDDNTPETDA